MLWAQGLGWGLLYGDSMSVYIVYVYIYIYTYICICIYIIYTYIYIYIYIYVDATLRAHVWKKNDVRAGLDQRGG